MTEKFVTWHVESGVEPKELQEVLNSCKRQVKFLFLQDGGYTIIQSSQRLHLPTGVKEPANPCKRCDWFDV